MFSLIKLLFTLLTNSQKSKFYQIQFLVILMSVFELTGLASIAPFMAVIANPSIIHENNILNTIFYQLEFSTKEDFIFSFGVTVLIAIAISSLLSMYTIWRLSLFASKLGAEIGDRLFGYYLNQNWLFHVEGSSAQLTKKIATETDRIAINILNPIMHLNAKIILAFLIGIGLFIYDPLVAMIGIGIFSSSYLILYKLVKKQLQINSKTLSEVATERFRLMNDVFGGIREVILFGKKDFYVRKFLIEGSNLALARGSNNALWLAPKYIMELLAFGSMIVLVLYLIYEENGDISIVLPSITLYALAGFKLLPAFQQIYSSYGQIKGNINAFHELKDDLINSIKIEMDNDVKKLKNKKILKLTSNISLNNVSFRYKDRAKDALNNISMVIELNKTIGIAGPSGSGKSTLLDIIMCIVDPCKGSVCVDDTAIDATNKSEWQSKIGYVPQDIFLTEGTVAENIAFGEDEIEINYSLVHEALKITKLNEFIENLEHGIHTPIGERGVKISGGQRQRLGIARALYRNPEILIFDEATSALDSITELDIMNSIYDLSGKKTILIIAHRMQTIKNCDIIYLMNDGIIQDKGNFNFLIENNDLFAKMAM